MVCTIHGSSDRAQVGHHALRFGFIELPDHAQALQAAAAVGQRAVAMLQAVDEVDQLILEMLAHRRLEQQLLAAFLRLKRALMQQQSPLADLPFQHTLGAVGVK